MIEGVKKILDKQRGLTHIVWTGNGHAPIYDVSNEELAQQVCQLFEPKPDEGRLLTPEQILAVEVDYPDRPTNPDMDAENDWLQLIVIMAIEEACKAQDAKTASIIRAECQERVKGILGFIEQYKEPHEHMGVVDFVGVPLDEWESFKEGVK